MSDLTQLADPNLAGTSDDVIIRIEIDGLTSLADEHNSQKRDLILAAADKLAAKYAADKTVVSAKLQAILSADRTVRNRKIYAIASKSYISDILPAAYKRPYATPEPLDNTPVNAMEEWVARAADLAKSISGIMSGTLDELQELRRSGDPADRKLYKLAEAATAEVMTHSYHARLIADLHRELSAIRDLDGYISHLKNMEVEVASLRKLADRRHKFSTAAKILLKMVFTFRSYDHVASTLSDARRYGGKWLSAINRDPALAAFLRIVRCPNCLFNFERWIERARIAQECGIDMPLIDDTYCEER